MEIALYKLELIVIVIVRGQNQANFLVNKHPRREGWWSKTFLFFFRCKKKKAFEQRVFYPASLYLASHSLYKSIGMSLYAVTNVRKPSAANI